MNKGIAYYPDLVAEMMRDHRALLEVFGDLSRSVAAADAIGFRVTLLQFRSLLTGHLLKEAIKLYIYLRQRLKYDEASYGLISSYKSEMDGISRVALAFVDEYMAKPASELDFGVLKSRLSELGRVLGDRIRREEAELYPLYHDQYE